MKVDIPPELTETWVPDSRGVLQGVAVWSDRREKEPIGILQGFSAEDQGRILMLPRIMLTLIACREAIHDAINAGTLDACVGVLPELERTVHQLGVELPNVNPS